MEKDLLLLVKAFHRGTLTRTLTSWGDIWCSVNNRALLIICPSSQVCMALSVLGMSFKRFSLLLTVVHLQRTGVVTEPSPLPSLCCSSTVCHAHLLLLVSKQTEISLGQGQSHPMFAQHPAQRGLIWMGPLATSTIQTINWNNVREPGELRGLCQLASVVQAAVQGAGGDWKETG